MAVQEYLIGAVILVAAFSVGAARLPLFQRDLRRPISCGVGLLGLLTILLSVHVLVTGFRLRESALATGPEGHLAGHWNGLILGAIMLLMISSLTFFFAMGVFFWSLLPSSEQRGGTERGNGPMNPFEPPAQTLNPMHPR